MLGRVVTAVILVRLPHKPPLLRIRLDLEGPWAPMFDKPPIKSRGAFPMTLELCCMSPKNSSNALCQIRQFKAEARRAIMHLQELAITKSRLLLGKACTRLSTPLTPLTMLLSSKFTTVSSSNRPMQTPHNSLVRKTQLADRPSTTLPASKTKLSWNPNKKVETATMLETEKNELIVICYKQAIRTGLD